MYNKHNFAVAKVAGRSDIKPDLQCVAFYGDRTVATDSFSLIEMSASGKKTKTPVLFWAKEIKDIKLKKGEMVEMGDIPAKPAPLHGDKYPMVDMILKQFDGEDMLEVVVNAEYLANICNVLKDLSKFQQVTLKIPKKKHSAIVITAQNDDKNNPQKARALLMPIVKNQ